MEKVAVEMIEKNGITVTRSKYCDSVFSEENEIKVPKKVNTELGPDSISAYAFTKSYQKHRVAVSSGVN